MQQRHPARLGDGGAAVDAEADARRTLGRAGAVEQRERLVGHPGGDGERGGVAERVRVLRGELGGPQLRDERGAEVAVGEHAHGGELGGVGRGRLGGGGESLLAGAPTRAVSASRALWIAALGDAIGLTGTVAPQDTCLRKPARLVSAASSSGFRSSVSECHGLATASAPAVTVTRLPAARH